MTTTNLTARQTQILCQFVEMTRQNGRPATYREIADVIGKAHKVPYDSLKASIKKGYLAKYLDGVLYLTDQGRDFLRGICYTVNAAGVVTRVWQRVETKQRATE